MSLGVDDSPLYSYPSSSSYHRLASHSYINVLFVIPKLCGDLIAQTETLGILCMTIVDLCTAQTVSRKGIRTYPVFPFMKSSSVSGNSGRLIRLETLIVCTRLQIYLFEVPYHDVDP